jgi:hypothetical protein
VVVCRPSLTLNWAAEIRRFFPHLAVYEASGTTPQPVPGGTGVIVIGSAALAAKPRTTKSGGKEFGWVKALAAAGPKALIIDEGQDTKERGANRSQACEQLAASVTGRNGLVLDLTGTAILNRPRELCQQLVILGRIGEFGGRFWPATGKPNKTCSNSWLTRPARPPSNSAKTPPMPRCRPRCTPRPPSTWSPSTRCGNLPGKPSTLT